MLRQRVISAAILIPIVGAAAYLGGLFFFALVLLAGLLAGYEFFAATCPQECPPFYLIPLLLIALLIADGQRPEWGLLQPALLFGTLGALTLKVFHENKPGSLKSWALMLAGALYIGLSLSYFPRLRTLDRGLFWLLVALLGTWTTDTGAYFVGSAFGRRPFFSKISPHKTWEGAVSGIVSGIALVSILGRWLLGLGWGQGIALGAVLALGATFGDLAESLLKRQVGIKDFGRLIPGHGGMLDRVDSLLFVVPLVYYMAIILV
ncbi:MAG: phosphatidate cytidylyltransferase [Chloroflexi bacterium]|nr:phosphatidate cytidylyltransferase [Chloroflexota bacterium]